MKRAIPLVPIVALMTLLLIGCDDSQRVAEVAERAADRQADQNKEMVQLNREVAEGTKRLVEADAKARDDALAMQTHLHLQQAEVGQQRDQLESERREIADKRLRESILAPILANLGPLRVGALVLVFCALLVYGLDSDKGEGDVVAEILIEELVAERPILLPPATVRQSLNGRESMSVTIADQTGVDVEDAGDD
jgi:hypothetical protein